MSQPKYIKGLPAKEYYRQYRKNNALKDYGREYYAKAQKKHRLKNPDKMRMDKARRRARLTGARVQKYIQKKNIWNWASRDCGICKKPIDGEYHLDHIIPLSKGGEHSEGNLQLAHPFCNQSKFNAIMLLDGVDRAV